MKPLRDIPFNIVIKSISGKDVIRFDENNEKHKKVLEILIELARLTSKYINSKGISSKRLNEVGNKVEKVVKEVFKEKGIIAKTPQTTTSKTKSSGYPDIIFWYNEEPYYLECKTFNKSNLQSTQRTFYFSPSENFKVTYDTIHFMLAFEIYYERDKNKYKCKSFKIISIESLSVDLKYEFNSDNKRMYSNIDGAKILHQEEF